MAFRCGRMLAVLAILTGMIGCSMDTVSIMSHPEKTKPNNDISVSLADLYIYYDTTGTLKAKVQRDSVHFVAGFPSGWTITSLTYYVARNMKLAAYYDSTVDSAAMETAMAESLIVYKSRSTAMTADAGLANFMKHKTFKAARYDSTDDSMSLRTDSVAQWLAYSNPCNILFPAGSKPDKVMKNTDTSGMSFSDSIGMTIIPIFIYATVKTGSVNGNFKLFYFTKTGTVVDPATLTNPLSPSYFDQGNMVFVPININPNNQVMQRPMLAAAGQSGLSVYPAFFTRDNAVTISVRSSHGGALGIYDLGGSLVQEWKSTAPVFDLRWDAMDRHGRPVKTGTYLVRLNSGSGSLVKTIRCVR